MKWLFAIGLFMAAIFIHADSSRAQWVQANGTSWEEIYCFAIHNGIIFAGTDGLSFYDILSSSDKWPNVESYAPGISGPVGGITFVA